MVTVFRLQFSREQVDRISPNEKELFFLVSHMANELSILTKILMMALSYPMHNDFRDKLHSAQFLCLMRLWVGKLYEAWHLIEEKFVRNQIAGEYVALLTPDGQSALERLKEYFDKQNLVVKIRNNFSFHYPEKHFSRTLSKYPANETMEIFISEKNINSLMYCAENVINHSMCELIAPGNFERAIEQLANETHQVSSDLIDFAGAYVILIYERYLGDKEDFRKKAERIDIGTTPNISSLHIPFLVEVPENSEMMVKALEIGKDSAT